MLSFEVVSTDKKARMGLLHTTRGTVETPAFLPVGTQAAVKALSPDDLKAAGCQIVLASTYHLYLRPGIEVITAMGGIHQFMSWDGPIFTDSGGFQVFSLGFGIEHGVGKMVPLFGRELVLGELIDSETKTLSRKIKLAKVAEEGPTFESHLDGSIHFFPPEKSIECQIKIGADLITALDELTSPLHDYAYTKAAMERTHRWEKRSLDYFLKWKLRNNSPPPGIFGVIQGGPFEDLRRESAKFINDNDFFGVAVGGALINQEKMIEILDWVYPYCDPQRPRHLFGIGTIPEIFLGVERGIDTFDAVVPTRFARVGRVFNCRYKKSRYCLDINKKEFAKDPGPLAEGCSCYTCRSFSRGYLHHLFRSRELLAYRLASIHNLTFIFDLMKQIREAIAGRRLEKLKDDWL